MARDERDSEGSADGGREGGADGGAERNYSLRRRGVLLGLLATTAGCSRLLDGGERTATPTPEPSPQVTVGPDLESGTVESVHIAGRVEGLPTPETPPALGITNQGVFAYLDRETGWRAFAAGTADSPNPGGYFETVDARRQHRTVYASESLDAYPSVQEALATMRDSAYRRLEIVGGRNVLSAPLDVPPVGEGIAPRESVEIVTAGDAYLTQADGANLPALVRSRGAVAAVDVNLDGNRANNERPVTGVHWEDVQGYSRVQANVFDCDTGVAVVGNTESAAFDVYVSGCGVGVVETDTDDGQFTPDENLFVVRGHGNDGPYYRKDGPFISTDLLLGVEGCPGDAVVLDAVGSTTVRGIIRTAGRNGVSVTAGDAVLAGLGVISCAGNGVVFDGGKGQVLGGTFNNLARGVLVAENEESEDIKVAYPNVINVAEYAVEFRSGRGLSLVDPQNVQNGSRTGAAVALATRGETTAHVSLSANHVTKRLAVGDAALELDMQWLGALDDGRIGRIPNPVEGMWGYNGDDGTLNVYDGTEWTRLDGTPK